MKLKTKLKNQQGLSTLVLVFVIASLLALVVLVLQLNSLLAARRAAQIQNGQTAFFAVEGALYKVIQEFRDNPESPPGNHEYQLGKAEIKRVITQLEEDSFKIEITADVKNARRKLIGYYKIEETGEPPDPPEDDLRSSTCHDLEPNVSYGDLEFRDDGSFNVEPGESWIRKGRVIASGNYEFVTFCNNSATDTIYIPGDEPDIFDPSSQARRWLCHGICPHFFFYHLQGVFEEEDGDLIIFEPGNTVKISEVAILDDDPDERINTIYLLDQDRERIVELHSCPQGYLAAACEYTLQEGETGGIEIWFEDSAGVDEEARVTTGSGEIFWFEEVEPEPD